jgi:hypothetical protein
MRKSNRKLAAINPLTELRRLLGTEDKPISTSKLAALADIPADTLRSTETGRRSFNAELRKGWPGAEWSGNRRNRAGFLLMTVKRRFPCRFLNRSDVL